MRYASTNVAAESGVTQASVKERIRAKRRRLQQTVERAALRSTNKHFSRPVDGDYYARGFIHGLVIGALAIAVLAVVMLGQVHGP